MQICLLMGAFVALFSVAIPAAASGSMTAMPDAEGLHEGRVFIVELKPKLQEGAGYKLVYILDAPIEAFWRFKTDFDNDFLVTNKFIESHQLIRHHGNIVVTENLFSKDLYFHRRRAKCRWQTTLWPAEYRLDFELLNPKQCGQKFHYGHIQLEAVAAFGAKTKVTQVAYFNFFGVFFWVKYPWYAGMRHFLKYTARWEQETFSKLRSTYIKKSAQ